MRPFVKISDMSVSSLSPLPYLIGVAATNEAPKCHGTSPVLAEEETNEPSDT